MANKKQKNTGLKVLLVIEIIILLIVSWGIVSHLVSKGAEQQKFIQLDAEMHGLLDKLQVAVPGVAWKFEKDCTDEESGDFPTGWYDCEIVVSFDNRVTSMTDVFSEQEKLTGAIQNDNNFDNPTNASNSYRPADTQELSIGGFSEGFLEKEYGVECGYSLHTYNTVSDDQQLAGTVIRASDAGSSFEFDCAIDHALHPWYKLTNGTL